jgi:hypothetical protein
MLAIYSVCEVSAQAYLFLPTILILTDTKIPLLACFYASAFPLLWAALNATFTLLFISLERLIAMLFPLLYVMIKILQKWDKLGIHMIKKFLNSYGLGIYKF